MSSNIPPLKFQEIAHMIHMLATRGRTLDLMFVTILRFDFNELLEILDYLEENREMIVEICKEREMSPSIIERLTADSAGKTIRDCCLLLQKVALLLEGGKVH